MPHSREDLVKRLGSDDIHESYPALWELMWREAAKRRWTLAPKPVIGGKTPDQLIEAPHPFALEVVTVHEMWIDRHSAFATQLRDALEEVPTDLVWSLHITGTVPYHYDIHEAVARFRTVTMAAFPPGSIRILCDDAGIVQLEPHPELTGEVTGVRITDFGARWTANDKILWEKIDQKARAYRPAVLGDLSLVVAVCVAAEFGIHINDMANALYGKITVDRERTLAAREHGGGLQADRRGGWFLVPERTHVAAVIFGTQRTFAPLAAEAYVFTNPYAVHPVPVDAFLPWPTTRWEIVKPDEASGDWDGTDATLVLP